jgi:trehalose 6-phosphate synthase
MEIPMTQWEVSNFYDGVCNAAFWPLYHDAVIAPVFRPDEFEVYRLINQRFADAVARNAPIGAVVWVHDYHLQLVPAILREARPDLRIGFFLHVPFPSAAEFDRLPWKDSVLHGLLGADLIGFQTADFAERFMKEACRCVSAKRDGDNLLLQEPRGTRCITVGAFPIGPDARRLAAMAALPALRESAATIRADFDSPELILLGVDRLDYTKGIDIRISAVTELLKSEEFRGRDVLFIQVAMPSRSDLAAYQQFRVAVDEALRLANAELVALGLRSIHCIHEALSTEQVVALFVASDVMLVTSLADGMNLVSKEFVACCREGNGRLVLSKKAGAAAQLRDAWLVEPDDIADLKCGIGEAIRANEHDARERMGKLRQVVFEADAMHWAESFLTRLRECR